DDGNSIPDDTCNNKCKLNPQGIPVLGCEDVFGPNLTPTFINSGKFSDTKALGTTGPDTWKTRGDFNLAEGINVDPDSENVRLIMNQPSSPAIYDGSLPPPSSFVQSGSSSRPKWKFLNKLTNTPTADGLRKVQFALSKNKIKYRLDGRNHMIAI